MREEKIIHQLMWINNRVYRVISKNKKGNYSMFDIKKGTTKLNVSIKDMRTFPYRNKIE